VTRLIWDELEWCATLGGKRIGMVQRGYNNASTHAPGARKATFGRVEVVTGWVLYFSTDIEGYEGSEEGIHPPDSE